MRTLYLASQSPYRRELLSRLNIPFETEDSRLNEDSFKNTIDDPISLAKTLAREKAKAVWKNHTDALVIGSDQVCLLDKKVMGKPLTVDRAKEQLKELSGKTHTLATAVCVLGPNQQESCWVDETHLTMRYLTTQEIERYIQFDSPLDCAGSYKIESLGVSLFSKIETHDFTSIIGLPLLSLVAVLREYNFQIP